MEVSVKAVQEVLASSRTVDSPRTWGASVMQIGPTLLKETAEGQQIRFTTVFKVKQLAPLDGSGSGSRERGGAPP